MDEVKLLPCPWCPGEMRRFQMKTEEGEVVEMVTHYRWPHCCVRTDSMTLAQWQTRPPIVTDEVVERVARAIAKSNGEHWYGSERGKKWNEPWFKHARAAIAAMPAIDQDGGELQGKRPRIPTPEMIAAAWAVIERDKKATGVAKLGPGLGVREIWQAMYDAASEPPAQPENDQCQD